MNQSVALWLLVVLSGASLATQIITLRTVQAIFAPPVGWEGMKLPELPPSSVPPDPAVRVRTGDGSSRDEPAARD